MSIIPLTTDDKEQQSSYDSEIINIVELFKAQSQELQGSYMAILNFSKKDFKYSMALKRLNIFELEVKDKLPTQPEFNKYTLKC